MIFCFFFSSYLIKKQYEMICMAVMLFITLLSAGAQKNIPASDIKVAMMKATRFMVEKVSNRGGYLWNYSPDFSRCWGELEAKPSMIWIELVHLLWEMYF